MNSLLLQQPLRFTNRIWIENSTAAPPPIIHRKSTPPPPPAPKMMTSPPIPFAPASLQLTSAPKLSYIYTPLHSSTHRSYPISTIRMCGISALPGKKTGPKKTRRKINPSPSSEAEELVRSIVRNISDKQPLLNTLNKHVQFLRTEHCFLLFEELGRSERWLQCLEVLFLSLYIYIYLNFAVIELN